MADTKKNLVIVESPSKAKTIEKYLGSRYRVIASKGHVRDLPKSRLGIDVANDFEPQYINIRGKAEDIKMLRNAAKEASKIYLATDPDREGEAISWHLATLLGIDPDKANRVAFNEITKATVQNALKNPRPIDRNLVDAQQARRVLDRLVGYEISPLLWKKVRRGLSAGRVQSAALKILCERESKIAAFVPEEYWTIQSLLEKGRSKFVARLAEKNGKKYAVTNAEDAASVKRVLETEPYVVRAYEEKERAKKPFPPYNTSSLQQDASIRLGFTTKRTMNVAQHLYESGLITYMRTDSLRVSAEAKAAALDVIRGSFGEEYCGNNFYANKKAGVQDAHEAIRPSSPGLRPEDLKTADRDSVKLYTLIWSRFLASQMKAALYNDGLASIDCGEFGLKAKGSRLLFDGFLKVYSVKGEEDEEKAIPALVPGETLKLNEVKTEQRFTEPPSRFTEAALVKELEEKGIGRPSTYATIITTLLDRGYVTREKKALKPTELGFVVTDLIEQNFRESRIVDTTFTAQMEDRLDAIENGADESGKEIPWKDVVRDFYKVFEPEVKAAETKLGRVELTPEVAKNEDGTDMLCEICGRPMLLRHGRFGDFYACSGYPECKHTMPIVKKTGVSCPVCGKEIVAKKSKKGKTFYGCSGWPDCKQVYWYKPVNEKCPKCGSLLVERRGRGAKHVCSNPDCDYKK